MSKATRYVTTPIYYVNAKPHLGHVYTSLICDVYARFQRMAGHDVFYLTGTDEHGQKVEHSARDRGIEPQALADENSAVFRDVLATYGITNDDFIRTTQPSHERQVQAVIQRLMDQGAIYLGEFEGWYDAGQEEYLTDTRARELDYKSPISGKPLERTREENYYFRLSAWQEKLEALFREQPDFVRPEARRNEVLGRLRDGLQDIPMSRTNFTWGIPVPGAPEHVIYVWIDALLNYITGLGLVEPESDLHAQRSHYWPATYHVVGKEILWFHAVIWPAMLMALELPLPGCVYAHSFWISEGQKMSKSLGNFIDPAYLDRFVDAYGLDMLRYYLATQGPLGATDSNFAADHFHEIYTTDLVNTLGNCASRTTAMIEKYFDGALPGESPAGTRLEVHDTDWPAIAAAQVDAAITAMDRFDLTGSLGSAIALVRAVDVFINATEPFKLAKDDARRDELGAILYQCLEAVRIASCLLWCAMPERMESLWKEIGVTIDPATDRLSELTRWGGLEAGTRVTKVALFPRCEPLAMLKG